MNNNGVLKITSLLSLLFLSFHLAGDIVYGYEPGGLSNLVVMVVVSCIWLCGTLLLAGMAGYRRLRRKQAA